MRLRSRLLSLALATALPAALAAQTDTARAPEARAEAVERGVQRSLEGDSAGPTRAEQHVATSEEGHADIIMPHITDSYEMEIPWFGWKLGREVCLGRHTADGECGPLWDTFHVGGIPVNLSPTKHVVMLLLAALLTALVLGAAARAHQRTHREAGRPRGLANMMEAVVLFVRNEVIVKNVGHGGEGYAPYLLTVFFFVLFANMLGLFPYMSTATGNISVTATLAVMSFILIEVAGARALGKGYWSTIFYWPHDMPFGFMKVVLFLILTPVELLGKFTKPFALAIRLFANMTAGHVIVLAFIGIIFTFGSVYVIPGPLLGAIGIMLLEVLVAFIQAYIFTLLTSVFIGQIRTAHH